MNTSQSNIGRVVEQKARNPPRRRKFGPMLPNGRYYSQVARPRGRKSRRSRRRRGGGQRGGITAPVGSQNAPVAFGGLYPQSYFRHTNQALKHPEYGEGARVSGQTLYATAGDRVATQGVLTLISAPSGSAYNNTFTSPIHPEYVDRLNTISNIYSYYCFRGVKVCYHAVCPTTQTSGVCLGVALDNALVAYIDNAYTSSAPPITAITSVIPSTISAWWQSFVLEAKQYTGDKLYLTAAPAENLSSVTLDATERNQFFQYSLLNRASGTFFPTVPLAYGYVYLEYVVDFYLPKSIPINILPSLSSRHLAMIRPPLKGDKRSDAKERTSLYPASAGSSSSSLGVVSSKSLSTRESDEDDEEYGLSGLSLKRDP